MILEIRVLELVRKAMLPKIRQKCSWLLHFSSLCTRPQQKQDSLKKQFKENSKLFGKRPCVQKARRLVTSL